MSGYRLSRTAIAFLLANLVTLVVIACSQNRRSLVVATIVARPLAAAASAPSGPPPINPNPFASSSTAPPAGYKGPLFQLSYHYPTSAPPPPIGGFPWTKTLNGQPISQKNAAAYVAALKAYITPNIKTLLYDYARWNPAQAGWYNQPWLANLQDPIHGSYVGSQFGPNTLPGQTQPLTTFVITYYDQRAGASLGRVWGATAMKPNFANNAAQFDEGSVIVKMALNNLDGTQWPAMQGAAQMQLYTDPTGNYGTNQLFQASFFQCDIVVKDSIASPKTQWVYSTLIFDNNQSGSDAWSNMIPLGAMWGNDPLVTDPANPVALLETWMNPTVVNESSYAIATLGWGGRLSGPNDGAVAAPGYVNGITANVAASACMSCHSAAEFPMKSFLLPTPITEEAQDQPPAPFAVNGALVLYPPSSPQWDRWYQDRNGYTPMDGAATALDYDMVYAFKSLPAWAEATNQPAALRLPALLRAADAKRRGFHANGLLYNGLP
jgi:hypothetical protein